MKLTSCAILFAVLICNPSQIFSQECVDGLSGENLCAGIDQYSFLSSEEIGGGVINDNWGWVSPETGREYALQGRSTGTAFIDISDPVNPVYLGNLPTHDMAILWRDVKVYSNHAFVVAESPNHGMQVFDLTQLDDVVDPPVEFTETAHYGLFGNAHNVAINEETGYAYCVGTNTFAGGLHFVNIQDPTQPFPAGGFESDGYTHDVQVVNYNGVDQDYVGKEIAFAANENTLTVVDVTDKEDPVLISRKGYDSSGYAHQGWLTEDHRYFLLDDELDESTFGNNTRTFVWDLEDLDDPQLVGFHESEIPSIDHNLYIKGNFCYQANYTGGLRVLQLNNLATLDIEEVAYYDFLPENNNVQFIGAWNVYPFFPSGTLIVSNMYGGFHVLDPNFEIVTDADTLPADGELLVYPNPTNGVVRIAGFDTDAESAELFDLTGKRLVEVTLNGNTSIEINLSGLSHGIYVLKSGSATARIAVR